MPRIGLRDLPFPNRIDPLAMLSNLRTAWENFRTIDRFRTLSVASGTTVLVSLSQTIFADATAGNIILTAPSAVGNAGLTLTIFKTDSTANTVTIDGNVLGGNLGKSRLVLVSDGAAWRIQILYDEGTYITTLTGCTTSPTGTASYVKNGKQVTLRIPALSAISNTTDCTYTGMPSHLRPTSRHCVSIPAVLDNSLDHPGNVRVETSGVLTFEQYATLTNPTAGFTNSGTKGPGIEASFSYTLQ